MASEPNNGRIESLQKLYDQLRQDTREDIKQIFDKIDEFKDVCADTRVCMAKKTSRHGTYIKLLWGLMVVTWAGILGTAWFVIENGLSK